MCHSGTPTGMVPQHVMPDPFCWQLRTRRDLGTPVGDRRNSLRSISVGTLPSHGWFMALFLHDFFPQKLKYHINLLDGWETLSSSEQLHIE